MGNYMLGNLFAALCPLLGIGMGIWNFYSYLRKKCNENPLDDGHDVNAFWLVAFIAAIISGMLCGILEIFEIHVWFLRMIVPDKECIIGNYIVKSLCAFLFEAFIARLSWYKCEEWLIEGKI